MGGIYEYAEDEKIVFGTLAEISGILRLAKAVKEAMDDA